jgi:RHS repeat-associated protein
MTTYNSTAYHPAADSVAYSMPVYEASPLNRVLERYGPGEAWMTGKKAVRAGYLTNIAKTGTAWADADSLVCALYKTTDDKKSISLSRTGNYNANELYVTRMKDEDDNTSYEFKDKQGQVVLVRQINDGKRYDTNYIYDSYGNQRAVLPPEASDRLLSSSNWTDADANLAQYAYLYKYDNRNRCIYKKIPGCEPVYYVYDKADRLIFTQDGEQRGKMPQEWTFSIPDAFGRVVLTGLCRNTLTYSADPLGTVVVKGTYNANCSTITSSYAISGINLSSGTITSAVVLSANFYDNYDFMGMAEIPDNTNTQYNEDTDYNTRYTGGYKGMLTGTLTAQMNTDGTVLSTYLYSVLYYDSRGRVIQTKSNNHMEGGIEKEYIAYNFTGQPTKRKHIHQATGQTTQTEEYAYTYDHAGRLLTTTHQLTDGSTVKSQVTLAENTYDELGRLKTNTKGGMESTQATYDYNVRSWTKSITGALFTENLQYGYTGNINQMQWIVDNQSRKYDFTYDNLSRLKAAAYTGIGSEQYGTAYSYDKHGNMLTLQRYGKTAASTYGLMDNLTMTYSGNQLVKAEDAAANISLAESADFKNYSNVATEYTYNANGSINKDLNKGISDIQYNSLNLPRIVDIKSPVAEARNEYTYSAGGAKLKVVQKWNPSYNTAPVVGSDVTVSALIQSKTTDYVGNTIYENGSLKRILVDGGYIENGVYYYYINDHLVNNRVVVNSSGTVTQKTHYYPFGMSFADSYDNGTDQPYKYNGKELDKMHGLNMYDYSARHLALDIPRFTTVDPLAEKYYSISPYAYVGNNPLKFIDPTGMDWYEDDKGNVMWQEGNDKTVTKTYEGENGTITINYRNVGTSYTVRVDDNVSVRYEQNSIDNVFYLDEDLKNINPQLSASTREPSFFENWSSSDNFFANLGYNILNDLYVSLQPFTFGLVGETTNELTGGIAHTNLDGTSNYKGIESFTNTVTWLMPTGEAKLGLDPLKTMNASQFSHAFKGTLSTFSPATRGMINRSMNNGMRFINNQIGSGNAVVFPVSVGSYYKPNNK